MCIAHSEEVEMAIAAQGELQKKPQEVCSVPSSVHSEGAEKTRRKRASR